MLDLTAFHGCYRRRWARTALRILPVLGVLGYLALPMSSPALAAGSIGTEEFIASSGAQAFRRQNFPAALKGFQSLLAKHPDDSLILRYIGMAHDRLGRYEEAVAAFTRALEFAPDDLATLFFLGVTQYKRGRLGEAGQAFRKVATNAPDTDYAARAREFLAALRADATEHAVPPAGKRWDAYFQLASPYDDNARSEPNESPKPHSGGLTEYLKAGYTPISTGSWQLRMEGEGYFSQYFRGVVDNLDIQLLTGAVALTHATTLGGVPIMPGLRYAFTRTHLDGVPFSKTHSVTASVDTAISEGTATKLYYRVDFHGFDVDGFLPSVTSRDGVTQAVGFTQYFLFPVGLRRIVVSLAYEYAHNDADGDNFDTRRHKGTVGVSAPLPQEITLDLAGSIGRDDYPNFNAEFTDRKTNRYTASIAISRPIWKRLKASLSYSHLQEESNFNRLDYKRNIVTLAISYSR